MKRQIIFLFILALNLPVNGYSQECGGGTLTLKIYTINGVEINSFDYEILSVSDKHFREGFLEKISGSEEALNNTWNRINEYGGTIREDTWEKIIDGNTDKTDSLKKFIRSDLNELGKVKSCLKFTTSELFYKLVLLKIKSKDKTAYIVCNFFGGCDREICLIWDDKFFRL